MPIISVICMLLTSLVRRVTREAVENFSMLEKANSWMCPYWAARRLAPKPWPAMAEQAAPPRPEAQRHHGHDHHQNSLLRHIGLIGVCDADVHDITHHQGDEQFKDGLHGAAIQRPGRSTGCMAADAARVFFSWDLDPPPDFGMMRPSRERNVSTSSGLNPRSMRSSCRPKVFAEQGLLLSSLFREGDEPAAGHQRR